MIYFHGEFPYLCSFTCEDTSLKVTTCAMEWGTLLLVKPEAIGSEMMATRLDGTDDFTIL